MLYDNNRPQRVRLTQREQTFVLLPLRQTAGLHFLFIDRRPQWFPNMLLLQCREWCHGRRVFFGCITDGFSSSDLVSLWSHRLLSSASCFHTSDTIFIPYCTFHTTGVDETLSSDCHLINVHNYCVCMKQLPLSDDTVCVVSTQTLAVKAHYL